MVPYSLGRDVKGGHYGMHGAFCTSPGDHWHLGEVGGYLLGHTLRQEGPEDITLCTGPPELPLLGTHAHMKTHTVPCSALDMPGISSVPFSHRALDVLKDFAPGAQLPVLLYNGEPKTDTITIEEFLEDQLGPPTSVPGAALRGGRGPPEKGRTS